MRTDHPSNPRSYPTFMDAVLAGAEKPTMSALEEWIKLWHESAAPASQHEKIHDALGLDADTYSNIASTGDEQALKDEVEKRREKINDPIGCPLRIRHGVPASVQETGGTNATLTDLPSGHAISIAVIPPADLIVSDPEMLRTMLRSHFARLVDNGYKVGVEVGPNDQDPVLDGD